VPLDVETRAVRWSFEAEEAFWASPLVDNGGSNVPSMDHHLYCLDADTAARCGPSRPRGHARGPTLDEPPGVLYVGDFLTGGCMPSCRLGQGRRKALTPSRNWIWSEVLVAGDGWWVTALDRQALRAGSAQAGTSWRRFPSTCRPRRQTWLRAAPVQREDLDRGCLSKGMADWVDRQHGAPKRWQCGTATVRSPRERRWNGSACQPCLREHSDRAGFRGRHHLWWRSWSPGGRRRFFAGAADQRDQGDGQLARSGRSAK